MKKIKTIKVKRKVNEFPFNPKSKKYYLPKNEKEIIYDTACEGFIILNGIKELYDKIEVLYNKNGKYILNCYMNE